MAQACIYLDDATMAMARGQAEREHLSLSKHIAALIHKTEEKRAWPQSFLDTFGALGANDIEEPAELDWELDAPRKEMWG